MERTAACSCGSLTVRCQGEPARISVCHCLECKRRTGSAFGVQARYPRAQVRIHGPSTTYVRHGDSGARITFHFCPTCGGTVFWELDGAPGHVAVAVGAFADPAFPAPTVSVYEDRACGWCSLGETVTSRIP